MPVEPRSERGTRAVRRIRRAGYVPGVLYGDSEGPVRFQISQSDLRQAVITGSNLFDVAVGPGKPEPAVIKEQQRDPIRGNLIHLDLMRVRLDEKIQSAVPIELAGADEAPGVREGGVLEHVTREVNVEALPTDVPEHVTVDVSELNIGDNLTLAAVPPGDKYEVLDDGETVIATVTPPRKIEEEPVIEEEAEVVGEEGEEAEAEAEGAEEAKGEAPAEGEAGESE